MNPELQKQYRELEDRHNELSDLIDVIYETEEAKIEKDPDFVRSESEQEKMDALLKEQWEISEKMEEMEKEMKVT